MVWTCETVWFSEIICKKWLKLLVCENMADFVKSFDSENWFDLVKLIVCENKFDLEKSPEFENWLDLVK